MVVEKLEYGLDMSTRKPDSLTTVQLPDTSTKMSDTTEVQLNNSESQLSTRPVVPDVIDVVNSSPAADSAFTFPVPGDLEAPKHDLIRCDGLIKPATDQPDVISWLPSSSEETSDFASSSSAVDSGWASRCSPVSSDYQHLETPSPQPSTPSSVVSVSPAHGPVTPSPNQRRSISQLMKGIFSKSTNKTPKLAQSRDSRTPKDIVLPGPAAGLELSPKDQKILSLMLERKEAERLREEGRDQNGGLSRPKLERSTTVVVRTARPASTADSRHVTSPSTASASVATSRTSNARPQQSADGSNRLSEPLPTASPTDSRRTSIYSTTTTTPLDARIQPLDSTRLKFAQKTDKRRQSVEQRLEQQRREMEDKQRQLKLKQEQELQRANSLRMNREQQQALRARLANEKVQQKHEMISQQRQKSVNDLSMRREELDARLAAAEAKAQKIKEEEIQKTRTELHRRLEMSRHRQRQMEAELETWQQELAKFNQWQGDNADKVAQQTAALKSAAACRARLDKEKKQQDNMKRLMTDEEKRLAEMEATIESKDARAKALRKDKEEQIQRSRNRAMAMKQVRDELRAHYSMNDLDQLSRHAQLESRLLSRLPESSAQSSMMNSMMSLA